LDFQKVKAKELKEARTFFGANVISTDQKSKASEPIPSKIEQGLTQEQKQKIKAALEKVTSLDEMHQLQRILQSNKLPKDFDEKYGLSTTSQKNGEKGVTEDTEDTGDMEILK